MTLSKQAGFGVVAIIGFIVVISVLGFIGWRVYDSVQQKNDQTGSASQPKPQAKPNNNKIQIKELGIEITVPDSLKDLTYSIREVNGIKIADLSTTSLTTKESGCNADGQAPPLGGLFKRTGTYPAEPTYENGILVKQFTGYYLARQTPQSACSENQLVEESASTLRKDFEGSLESVKEIN